MNERMEEKVVVGKDGGWKEEVEEERIEWK